MTRPTCSIEGRTRSGRPGARFVLPRLAAAFVAGLPLAAAFSATLLATACQTFQRDLVVTSAGEADFALLDVIDETIALYRARSLAADLQRARELVAQGRTKTTLNSVWLARFEGLAGEVALLSGDRAGAKAAADRLAKIAPDEERKWLLEAWLAESPDKARAVLEEGRAKAVTNARIIAELAMLALARGEYREALALFDDALPSLGEAWIAVYSPERDKAFALKDSGAVSEVAAVFLDGKPLSFLGMVAIALEETTLLDVMYGGHHPSVSEAFAAVRSASWFGVDANPDDSVTRKDVAVFLWRAIAERKRQPELLTRYSKRYSGKTSPVPDVPVEARWFDAVLGCVEWSVMSLRDGKHFVPFELVTGIEFFEMAKKAQSK